MKKASLPASRLSMSISREEIPNKEKTIATVQKKLSTMREVWEILNMSGTVDNNAMLEKLTRLSSELRRTMSSGQKTIIDDIRESKSRGGTDLWGPFSEDDPFSLDNADDEFLRLEQKLIASTSKSWKIDAYNALMKLIGSLTERGQRVELYRSGDRKEFKKVFSDSALYDRIQEESKTIYTPFGVTFIVPGDAPRGGGIRGSYYARSIFSVVFYNSRTNPNSRRNTLKHEVRHNIFSAAEISGRFRFKGNALAEEFLYILGRNTRLDEQISRFKALNAPEAIIERVASSKRLVGEIDIAYQYIDGLKDELLANFDRLLEGDLSTDGTYMIDFLYFIQRARRMLQQKIGSSDYPALTQDKIDSVCFGFRDTILGFLKQLSWYIYVMKRFEMSDTLRYLLYISDMTAIDGIDTFIRCTIGENSYHLARLDFILDKTVQRLDLTVLEAHKRRVHDLSPEPVTDEERLLRALFGTDPQKNLKA